MATGLSSMRDEVSTTTTLRAAIYCRVSTLRQEDGSSLETQEAGCRRFAQDAGYLVDEAFCFREVHTGTEFWERLQLAELRQAIRNRLIDVVVAHSIDRLSRDPVHLGVILSEADHCGVEVRFVTEPLDDSPEGQLIRFVRGYAAKVEHEKIKERSMRGRRARVDAGKYLAGQRPPYGYRWADETKSRLAEDPVTAPIVRRLFREIAGGVTALGLAKQLTAEGIPTPTNKERWGVPTIGQIIRHPVYYGEARAYRFVHVKEKGKRVQRQRPEDEQVILHGVAPTLVTKEIALAASIRVRRNKSESPRRNGSPESALLRAGFARCGYCGKTLSAVNTTNHGTRYSCNATNRSRYGCPHYAIQANVLDAAVWGKVAAVLTRPDIIAAEVARLRRTDPTQADIAAIERRRADLARRERNLVARLADTDDADVGALIAADLKQLVAQKRQLDEERQKLVEQRESWEAAEARLNDLTVWCQTVATNLDGLTYQERRFALETLGVEVEVWRADHNPRFAINMELPILTTSSY